MSKGAKDPAKEARAAELRAFIQAEFQLVVKGKQPSHLITLIEDYELDPFCPKLDLDLLTVLAHCHIIGCQYVHLDNLLSRYGLPEELSSLKAAAKEASRQNIDSFASKIRVYLERLKCEARLKTRIEKAALLFVLQVYSKYYINIELKKVQQLLLGIQKDIEALGYKVIDGYIQLPETKVKQNNSAILQQKVKQLVEVARIMTKHE